MWRHYKNYPCLDVLSENILHDNSMHLVMIRPLEQSDAFPKKSQILSLNVVLGRSA